MIQLLRTGWANHHFFLLPLLLLLLTTLFVPLQLLELIVTIAIAIATGISHLLILLLVKIELARRLFLISTFHIILKLFMIMISLLVKNDVIRRKVGRILLQRLLLVQRLLLNLLTGISCCRRERVVWSICGGLVARIWINGLLLANIILIVCRGDVVRWLNSQREVFLLLGKCKVSLILRWQVRNDRHSIEWWCARSSWLRNSWLGHLQFVRVLPFFFFFSYQLMSSFCIKIGGLLHLLRCFWHEGEKVVCGVCENLHFWVDLIIGL